MRSLLLRNLFFTILQPGIVVGLIPYFILGERIQIIFAQPLTTIQYMAAIVFLVGFLIMSHCIISFAVWGKGTLSPADPTKQLVIKGLYNYSRNPMYVGVLLMLLAQAFFFESNTLWGYTLAVFIAFNFFILFFEEPRLRKDFGAAYTAYSKKVRRWF